EVAAELLARVAHAEAVRAERHEPAGEPARDEIAERLHIVRRRDEGPRRTLERLLEIWHARRSLRVQAVVPLALERVAAELLVARDAPHVRRHAEALGEDLLRP